jgi:CheY-like chemotaxis protein
MDGDLAGVHVLVVEGTDDSREVLRIVLEYCGALVTTVESAEKAKRIREVKAVAETKGLHIPAIAITAYRDRREELLTEGFAELLEKPLDPMTLCGVVRRHARF